MIPRVVPQFKLARTWSIASRMASSVRLTSPVKLRSRPSALSMVNFKRSITLCGTTPVMLTHTRANADQKKTMPECARITGSPQPKTRYNKCTSSRVLERRHVYTKSTTSARCVISSGHMGTLPAKPFETGFCDRHDAAVERARIGDLIVEVVAFTLECSKRRLEVRVARHGPLEVQSPLQRLQRLRHLQRLHVITRVLRLQTRTVGGLRHRLRVFTDSWWCFAISRRTKGHAALNDVVVLGGVPGAIDDQVPCEVHAHRAVTEHSTLAVGL